MVRKSADGPFERVPLVQEDSKFQGMLFDLAGLARLLRRGRRRPLGDVPAQCRRHAVRAEARARVPLPGIHGARAAQDRRRRGHRGASRHRDSRQGGADDGEQGRAGGDQRAAARAADGRARTARSPAVRRRQGRLLSHRARRADRRTRDGVAAVHHRRARSIRRRRSRSPSRDATPAPRRSKKSSSRRAPKTTTASSELELVYSVNGAAEKTVRLFEGSKRLPEVSAGHTFYLEELNVSPGDFVSVLRARRRQRCGGRRQEGDERHLLPAACGR